MGLEGVGEGKEEADGSVIALRKLPASTRTRRLVVNPFAVLKIPTVTLTATPTPVASNMAAPVIIPGIPGNTNLASNAAAGVSSTSLLNP
jgi:hypothetical protein